MKLKLNDIIIVLYFLLLSLVLKDFLYIPLGLAVLVFIFGERLDPGLKNLVYVSLATLPFLPFFVYWAFYLLFIVFGILFERPNFIKNYLLGFAVAHIVRLVVYYSHSSFIGLKLTPYLIIAVLVIFLSLSYLYFIKRFGAKRLKSMFLLNSEEYKIIIITMFFAFFVLHVMFNNSALHMSNASEIYTKQRFVIESIEKWGSFGQYYPGTGMGEQFFFSDSQTHFTKDILILSTIYLRPWFGDILVYNAYQMFIAYLVILGAAVLLKEALSIDGKYPNRLTVYFIILGSLAIGLSFQFVRILESLKSFSAHPINLLLFAMILSKPKKPTEWVIIGYLMLVTYMVHVIQAMGVLVFVIGLLIAVYLRDLASIKNGISYLFKNKFKVILLAVIFIGVAVGYTYIGGLLFKPYLRDYQHGIWAPGPFIKGSVGYIKNYFTDAGTTPFSFSYGDLGRLDRKEAGFFLSFFGVLSAIYIILNLKNEHLKKARLFVWGFIVQFLLYTIFIYTMNVGTLEPGYRIIHPYSVVMLSLSISAAFNSMNKKIMGILLIVFFAFFVHGAYYARINLDNIHGESIISPDGSLKGEKDFIRSLPNDGRFITYGLYANGVDAGIAHTTGHYFSRYQYNIWSETNNIYNTLHTTESFGNFPELNDLSGIEMTNLMSLGGYKYIFMYLGHPAAQTVLQKVYPNYTIPIYGNPPDRPILVILMVNKTNYAEKVSVLRNIKPEIYKTEEGWKYVGVSNLKRYGVDMDSIEYDDADEPINPIPLSFSRPNPDSVRINGNFENDDWVVFKDEYFPRWKAFMNGKEIPIYPTNFNMILLRASKGSEIELKYDLLYIEKVLNTASLLAVILCSLLFIFLFRFEKEELLN